MREIVRTTGPTSPGQRWGRLNQKLFHATPSSGPLDLRVGRLGSGERSMSRPFRAACAIIVMLLTTLSVLVSLSPRAAALSNTWTTDADFNCSQPGVICNGVQVIETSAPAHVDLLNDSIEQANQNPP